MINATEAREKTLDKIKDALTEAIIHELDLAIRSCHTSWIVDLYHIDFTHIYIRLLCKILFPHLKI